MTGVGCRTVESCRNGALAEWPSASTLHGPSECKARPRFGEVVDVGAEPKKSAAADEGICQRCGRPHVRNTIEFRRVTTRPKAQVCLCDECGCRSYLLKIAALGRGGAGGFRRTARGRGQAAEEGRFFPTGRH